jgi:hypothetical protein
VSNRKALTLYSSFTMLGLSVVSRRIEDSRVTNMARIAPERSNFFVRSNYVVVVGKPEQGALDKHFLTAATNAAFNLAEQAIRAMEDGAQADAALRQLWASLLELKHLRASDPGIRMAAQDLYEAAAAIAAHKGAGAGFVDLRLWRLLKEAQGRLRARLT